MSDSRGLIQSIEIKYNGVGEIESAFRLFHEWIDFWFGYGRYGGGCLIIVGVELLYDRGGGDFLFSRLRLRLLHL